MLLKCEICGSTDFVKDNGVFICQNCGMKYTLAEVKKMISAACVEDNGEKPQEKEPATLETAVIGPTVYDQFSDLEAAQNNIEEGNDSSRKKCPFCGAELFDDADEFCMMCGSKVAFSEETSTLPNNLDKNKPICPNCGNPKYDENDDFCIYCGYAFGLDEDNDIADNSNIDKEPLEVVPLTDSLDSATAICAACGQPLYDANDTFCIYCGARIAERESDSPIEPMIVTPTSCETRDEAVVSDEEYNQTDKEAMVHPGMVVITTEGVKFDENTTDNNSSIEEEIPQVDNSTAINDTEETLVEETPLPPQEEEIEVTNALGEIVFDVTGDDSLRVADISEVNVTRIEETKHCEQTDPTDSESFAHDVIVGGGLENDSETSSGETETPTTDAKPGHDDQKVSGSKKMWVVIAAAVLIVIVIVGVVSIPKRNDLAANESLETELVSNTIAQESSLKMVEQPKQKAEKDAEQKQSSPIKLSESSVENSPENTIEMSEFAEVTSISEIEQITEESFDPKEGTQQETKAKEGIKKVVEETEKASETEESRQNETTEPETTTVVQNGWAKVGDAYCYFVNGENKSGIGRIQPGWCTIGGSPQFYIDSSGKPYQNQWLEVDGNTYYFGNDCARVDNRWISINGVEYYFGDKGKLLRNGSAPDGRQTDENGALKQ